VSNGEMCCWGVCVYLYLYQPSCFPDKSNGEIRQEPEIFANSSSDVTLTCDHDNSDHLRLFWYKQTKGSVSLSLLIFSIGQNQVEIEEQFKTQESKYAATRPEIKKSTLQINKLETNDSALYYCATSTQYYITRDVKEPEVEILKPSGIETRCKKTITLVCVAEKFYPDHVSITWTLGDKEIKENVATDPYATQDKTTKLFSMTSRLKVSKKEFKPKNKYRCTVNFYNGTHDISDNTDEINGIEEDYVKSAQWMKLAYSVFIAKSGLYGLVVLVYVMRKVRMINL
uniref:Ig-like domain-containing protein n=1 Tax=Cyprinus carpio carpio TaxID=630221 RepID=A0A8C1DR11_CYPCA